MNFAIRKLKEISKRIPGVCYVYNKCVELALKLKSSEDVFTNIYIGKKWGGRESVSGVGSDLDQTRVIISEIPAIMSDFNIHSILDIPCGDFHWMNSVDLNSKGYIGADIVEELMQINREKYSSDGVRFCKLNLLKDPLPKVDLIFCRDCLVHLSFEEIFLALNNICDSGSTYLLTTTFTDRQHNPDITTGLWRALNLEIAPFAFAKPLRIINEECTEANGAFRDKSLGLWIIADIKTSLARRST